RSVATATTVTTAAAPNPARMMFRMGMVERVVMAVSDLCRMLRPVDVGGTLRTARFGRCDGRHQKGDWRTCAGGRTVDRAADRGKRGSWFGERRWKGDCASPNWLRFAEAH